MKKTHNNDWIEGKQKSESQCMLFLLDIFGQAVNAYVLHAIYSAYEQKKGSNQKNVRGWTK